MFNRFKIDKATGLPQTPNGGTWEVIVHRDYGHCFLVLWNVRGRRESREVYSRGSRITIEKLKNRHLLKTARKMLNDIYPSEKEISKGLRYDARIERAAQKKKTKIEKFEGVYPPKKL